MIKAIVIDVGGVYVKGTRNDVFSYLSKKFKVDLNNSIEYLYTRFNTGKIDSEEFFKKISNKLKIDKHILKRAWLNAIKIKFKPDKNIEKILKNLKESGYILTTITNTNKFHLNFHRKAGNYKYFTVVIASCEVGLLKPNKKIYLILMKRLKLKPEEILFIDNTEENLITAKRLGMKTITYTNPGNLKKTLSNLHIK